MNYAQSIAENARLYALKELAAQVDGRLNVLLVQHILDLKYGINRSREWTETQLRKLAELDAVELLDSEVMIARITRAGRDHLEQRAIIAGVTRPADVE
ncbi:hypothetical protein [Allopontixanthobacter sp.]|uniref:VpaChn25_0724 family phage protein n=1 Tax=Allopontixanthobacter sp. TaxID=2906452 RepID=UPI002ABCB8F4|nr:hypothetical protein [Allopontixanthobacter sp.]MDZ4307547.1 hypothetical protein [Allopontixanthobacter sp.]